MLSDRFSILGPLGIRCWPPSKSSSSGAIQLCPSSTNSCNAHAALALEGGSLSKLPSASFPLEENRSCIIYVQLVIFFYFYSTISKTCLPSINHMSFI